MASGVQKGSKGHREGSVPEAGDEEEEEWDGHQQSYPAIKLELSNSGKSARQTVLTE